MLCCVLHRRKRHVRNSSYIGQQWLNVLCVGRSWQVLPFFKVQLKTCFSCGLYSSWCTFWASDPSPLVRPPLPRTLHPHVSSCLPDTCCVPVRLTLCRSLSRFSHTFGVMWGSSACSAPLVLGSGHLSNPLIPSEVSCLYNVFLESSLSPSLSFPSISRPCTISTVWFVWQLEMCHLLLQSLHRVPETEWMPGKCLIKPSWTLPLQKD